MPSVVQFGAGSIGRGFMGQLFTECGYEVVFVDVDAALVGALNARRSYPLRLVDGGDRRDLNITPARAVNARDIENVARELAKGAFVCTAVGVNIFADLAPTLAAGIAKRAEARDAKPLNILCCENQAGAGALLREAVGRSLPDAARVGRYFAEQVGFVDSSVGRMVPAQTPAMRAEDPLLVVAEPYHELPIDAAAWIGPVPKIEGVQPKTNFAGYVARKLFTHNGGHALLAYLGHPRGHTYIWQAAEDPEIVSVARAAWAETGAALIAEYGFAPAEQRRHEDDLLHRFRNRALGDTIARVARDPLRKLRPDDRLVGGALLCLKHGIVPDSVCRGIAAALRYEAAGDPTAKQVQAAVRAFGATGALTALYGLPAGSPLLALLETGLEGGRNHFVADAG